MTTQEKSTRNQIVVWIDANRELVNLMADTIRDYENNFICIDKLTTMVFKQAGYECDIFGSWQPVQDIQNMIKFMYDSPVEYSY